MFAQKISDSFFKRFDNLEYGSLTITTPDGKTRVFEGRQQGVQANIIFHTWQGILNLMRQGDVGLAHGYRLGHWDSDCLTRLTTLGLANKYAMRDLLHGSNLARILAFFSYFRRSNTLKGSQKNIEAHYDLGNDFYKIWLDPSMTYSAGLFRNAQDTLETAQHNKYSRILDCLETNSGKILEVGCGWGGFAQHATNAGDFEFKGITLSKTQHAYAQKRLHNKGQIMLEDYRHQQGKVDSLVSIEMFEAVGERYWQVYFSKIKDLLRQKGKAVIQTITINERDFEAYRLGSDFIRSYIFPGGMLPSPSRFKQEAARAGLQTGELFNFGPDYARTLEYWLNTFEAKQNEVEALGFDQGFIRLWRFYLASCIAGFRTGHTNVMQVTLKHA